MTKKLTRAMLEEYGITNIDWHPIEQQWWINRYAIKCGKSKTKRHVRVKITEAICKHKYAPEKRYPVISFSYKGKPVGLPLARVIWAWFNSEVPAGYDVDHIDNNQFNNRLENLQLLTRQQNLKKRFSDNPDACHNQYEYIKTH